ncbi:MAG: glutathione S-transferase family protein [Methylococcales bacterium]|nr:glutathione S-transferase family protein [Methylococcales bacterium]
MKLYHCSNTRSFRPLWLLEELGISYDIAFIDVFNNKGQQQSYLKINPLGTVPTLVDDDITLYEAGAICLYLSDKYTQHNLAPRINAPNRGHYYQWMFFVPGTMEPPLVNIFLHTQLLEVSKRRQSVIDDSKKRFERIAAVLDHSLHNKTYILGEYFSTADIMIVSTLDWFPELISNFETLNNYHQTLSQRPAFKRALLQK